MDRSTNSATTNAQCEQVLCLSAWKEQLRPCKQLNIFVFTWQIECDFKSHQFVKLPDKVSRREVEQEFQ